MIVITEVHYGSFVRPGRQPTSIPGCVSEAGGTDPLHVLAMFTNTSGGRPSRPSWSLDMSKTHQRNDRIEPCYRPPARPGGRRWTNVTSVEINTGQEGEMPASPSHVHTPSYKQEPVSPNWGLPYPSGSL
ncbi:uncharacterized protein [Panulirus ornatus]|uniref:uncharacterized protein isoform X5 n=1 Tax=Panulirus ornatus TaxID=150431 RepID=UPI003A8B620F